MMTPTVELLTQVEAASRLGVTAKTLETWRSRQTYKLKFVKVGRLVRYRPQDINDFLESRVVSPGEPKSTRRTRRTR
jgi:excisionase family DNA binding protein